MHDSKNRKNRVPGVRRLGDSRVGRLGFALGCGLAGLAAAGEVRLPALEGLVGNHRPPANQSGFLDEYPAHAALVPSFALDACEITKSQWDAVRAWGLGNGYDDLPEGTAGAGAAPENAASHPVVNVSWHDAVKWCNARSEKEGKYPVYRLEDAAGNIYRTGIADQIYVLGDVVGYRLPTEQEWELAARGGWAAHDFPWGGASAFYPENISVSQARFQADGTLPVGQHAANAYGLFDMAGNVAEWCWDWYAEDAYVQPLPSGPDQPGLEHMRTIRGGSWRGSAADLRVSSRGMAHPDLRLDSLGFRTAQSLLPTGHHGTIERFTATEENGRVVLRWWASFLEDIDGFRVSRFENEAWIPVQEALVTTPIGDAYVLVDPNALPGVPQQYRVEMVINGESFLLDSFDRTATPLQIDGPVILLETGGLEFRWERRPDEQYQVIRTTNLLQSVPPEILAVVPEDQNVFVDPDPPPTAFYGLQMLAPPVP